MSEEVVVADEIQTGVFYVINAEGVMVLLDKIRAKELRDELNEFLGEVPVTKLGSTFPRNCDEPDLPVGTKLLDDEGDILIKVDGGWSWHAVSGVHPWDGDVYSWDTVSYEHSFTVIA